MEEIAWLTEIHQTTGRAVALATVYATLEHLEDRGLELLIPPRTSATLIGDLIEEHGNGRSRTWYWHQTIIALTRWSARTCCFCPLHL